MRVTTAFNRVLGLPGASVRAVRFEFDGVVVTVALRRRRWVCSGCGQVCAATHDTVWSRWRHLDLGGQRCWIACWWARPGLRFTRDFEDVVAWLAQQMARQPIARLLRVAWDTVGRIVERVVADRRDETRLAGLVVIGVEAVPA